MVALENVHKGKMSPKMVNPRDIAGSAEEKEDKVGLVIALDFAGVSLFLA